MNTNPRSLSIYESTWDIGQWAIFFEYQALPVMADSKRLLAELEEKMQERLAPKNLLSIVLQDPFLCLRLLQTAEQKKSHRLDHETTTVIAALLQLGVNGFRELLLASDEMPEDNPGLLKVVQRARIASTLAQVWSKGRMDINPEEVAIAALLGGAGDLLLWIYAPEIPERAEEKLRSGQVSRSAEAQVQSCGFAFKELTQLCAERWKLPSLLLQLLRGSDSVRAQVTRVCSNTARHILDETQTSTQALADDVLDASKLIPNAKLKWLVDALSMLPEARRNAILALACARKEAASNY